MLTHLSARYTHLFLRDSKKNIHKFLLQNIYLSFLEVCLRRLGCAYSFTGKKHKTRHLFLLDLKKISIIFYYKIYILPLVIVCLKRLGCARPFTDKIRMALHLFHYSTQVIQATFRECFCWGSYLDRF